MDVRGLVMALVVVVVTGVVQEPAIQVARVHVRALVVVDVLAIAQVVEHHVLPVAQCNYSI